MEKGREAGVNRDEPLTYVIAESGARVSRLVGAAVTGCLRGELLGSTLAAKAYRTEQRTVDSCSYELIGEMRPGLSAAEF